MKAALYIRVSTEEQAKEGFSIQAQEERLTAYCKSKGWRIYDVYVDDGYTGRDTNRPAYKEMLEDMEYWDVLVVLRMDRIHRNIRNFVNMFELLRKNGKHFVSVYENIDTTSAMGRFVVHVMAALAQLESELISERTKLAMEQAKKQGYHVGRPPKLFEKVYVDGHLKLKPTETAILIYELYTKKRKTIRQIARAVKESPATVWRTIKIMERLNHTSN